MINPPPDEIVKELWIPEQPVDTKYSSYLWLLDLTSLGLQVLFAYDDDEAFAFLLSGVLASVRGRRVKMNGIPGIQPDPFFPIDQLHSALQHKKEFIPGVIKKDRGLLGNDRVSHDEGFHKMMGLCPCQRIISEADLGPLPDHLFSGILAYHGIGFLVGLFFFKIDADGDIEGAGYLGEGSYRWRDLGIFDSGKQCFGQSGRSAHLGERQAPGRPDRADSVCNPLLKHVAYP